LMILDCICKPLFCSIIFVRGSFPIKTWLKKYHKIHFPILFHFHLP
jgi:hypothetical protein